MSAYTPQRVLLLELSERTSAKGNPYMSGWLGKASVVAFKAEHADKYGNPVWQVFVTEPQQEQQRAQITQHLGGAPKRQSLSGEAVVGHARRGGWRGSRSIAGQRTGLSRRRRPTTGPFSRTAST